ncbi:MAG: 50S ribosomal protein L13 [Flavobacteriales bacterium]|nr:50S ribosomal protein L13 [Flavobacteriales bacterium]MCB9446818.1 50S ribosomal protein L13 [Flavobacteriales bacterium]
MNTISNKTVSLNKATVKKEWFVIDAENEVLGRLSSKVAFVLRGKHKTGFTPHVDCGDHVIVINAEKVKLTGKKMEDKEYIRHSGYPGGQKITKVADMLDHKPTMVIEKAVRGMLPKNKLGNHIIGNLHVYAGSEHQHAGQNPQPLALSSIK